MWSTSEKSARYYYFSPTRFAGDMTDGRIPKKFRRHPKLSDFLAANCCRHSGTLSQIFCSFFKWLDIIEFLKPPLNDLMPQKFGGFLNGWMSQSFWGPIKWSDATEILWLLDWLDVAEFLSPFKRSDAAEIMKPTKMIEWCRNFATIQKIRRSCLKWLDVAEILQY